MDNCLLSSCLTPSRTCQINTSHYNLPRVQSPSCKLPNWNPPDVLSFLKHRVSSHFQRKYLSDSLSKLKTPDYNRETGSLFLQIQVEVIETQSCYELAPCWTWWISLLKEDMWLLAQKKLRERDRERLRLNQQTNSRCTNLNA